MSIDPPAGHFHLGSSKPGDLPLFLEASDLTTHGVIVGMTGSGKTGLGIVLLEECLGSGIPSLIIDPKGDMGNLMLGFPQLRPGDFLPWISHSAADDDLNAAAVAKAELWRQGLTRSGIAQERIAKLHETVDFGIHTPGSTAGIPMNVIGSLRAPVETSDAETLQDEIDGFVSSLLGLVGIDSDPLSSREHILLANIIHRYWSQQKDLDLGRLIGLVQQPPMRKLGVIDLDIFFPASERVKLAMRLNALAASPAFASWSEGPPLDIENLLYSASGKPRAAIVCLSHLSEEERQFVVTLLLSKMVTWMRTQAGTGDLRALIYMDEVFGYVPPVGAPPSKKPILTLLKQARAFGVGLVLSTQNPVDIDYKAISNAGTWMIGRLQTERDRDRLLDGMRSSDGAVDTRELANRIAALDKREFVLHSTRGGEARNFSTRWAMSFLAGPLTRTQIAQLTSATQHQAADTQPTPAEVSAHDNADSLTLAENESRIAPTVADTVPVRYLDPAVPYADALALAADGQRLQAALAVRVRMLFDETRANLRHETQWEAIFTPLGDRIDVDDALLVDYDDRDLHTRAPDSPIYILPQAKIRNKTWYKTAQKDIRDHLYRHEEFQLFYNPALKVFSHAGETQDAFEQRCQQIADTRTDEDVDKLREMLARKIDRINAAIKKSEDRLRELQFDAASRKQDQHTSQIMDIAGGLLGGLLGGRRSTRSIITSGLRRSQSKGRLAAKAEERLKSAENRYNELLEDRDELEDALSEDLFEIQAEWEAKARNIQPFPVSLEKTDIRIEELALVWLPQA